jgi:heptosyltransferase II
VRVGFAGEGRSLLLTAAVRRPARGELHLSREYLDLAARLGAAPDGPAPPPLAPDPAAAARAAALLAGADGARVAILGPGALYGPAKRWAPERFAAVGRALAGRGFAVLVCGSAAERAVCEAVAHDAGGRALAGVTDLPVQAALCARAAIVVCNDSGLAHPAAATGAPTVVIFGSTSSAWTAPLGTRVVVVQHAPPCSPCFQRTCRIGYRCLAAVTEPEVVRACLTVAA